MRKLHHDPADRLQIVQAMIRSLLDITARSEEYLCKANHAVDAAIRERSRLIQELADAPSVLARYQKEERSLRAYVDKGMEDKFRKLQKLRARVATLQAELEKGQS